MILLEDRDMADWHIDYWRQRKNPRGEWGISYAIYKPYDDVPIEQSWRPTQEQAEKYANQSLEKHKKVIGP